MAEGDPAFLKFYFDKIRLGTILQKLGDGNIEFRNELECPAFGNRIETAGLHAVLFKMR